MRATSKVDCSDGGESPRTGIFIVTGLGISTIVLSGDASPLGGSTFSKFEDTPRINAGNDIAFQASTIGTTKTDGIFVWDFATNTISTAVRNGDAAPLAGGSFAKNQSFDFDDAGDVILNAKLRASPALSGIFELGVADTAALVKTDAPPTDAFGIGSSFTRFGSTNGTSTDGNRIGLQVRVKDTAPPSAKAGVIRCASSPSGAFIDGEVLL